MAIKDIRLPDGSQLVLDEWVHYPLFSTVEFAAGSKPKLRAFTYVAGSNVPSQGVVPRVADDADTNQTVRTRTNQDEAFVVYAVTPEFFGLSDASATITNQAGAAPIAAVAPMVSRHNLLAMQRSLLVELFVGANINKPQLRVPLSQLSQSIGPVVHGTADGAGVLDVGTAGRVSSTNQWRLELPIYIEADRVFYAQVSAPEALADLNQNIRLRLYLDGMKRRPVA